MAKEVSDYGSEIIKFQGNDKYLAILVKYIKDCEITYRLIFGPLKDIEFTSESEEYRSGSLLMYGPSNLYKLILTLDKKEKGALTMIDINSPKEYETAVKILETMM